MTHQESVDQRLQMYRMYLEGATFQKIGEMFGMSKQAVYQKLRLTDHRRASGYDKIIYPHLKSWADEHNVSFAQLGRAMGSKANTGATTHAKNVLTGVTKMSLDDIKGLIKLTGLSFEKVSEKSEDK